MFLSVACYAHGKSPFRDAEQEWIDFFNGKEKDFTSIKHLTEWGVKHEDTALTHVIDELNKGCAEGQQRFKVYEVGYYTRDHNGKLTLSASPDFLFTLKLKKCMIDGTGELKCVGPWTVPRNQESVVVFYYEEKKPYDKVLYYYLPQVQMQMHLANKHYSIFASWTPLNGYKIWLVERDALYIELMLNVIEFAFTKYYRKNVQSISDQSPYYAISDIYDSFLKRGIEVVNKSRDLIKLLQKIGG
jgi:hypothetical protein